jgi:hypothetical protein
MTREAVAEAEKYVRQSLESQKQLGYKRPARPVVKAAVTEAAAAVEALLALSAGRMPATDESDPASA